MLRILSDRLSALNVKSADQSRDVSNILTAVMTSPSLHASAVYTYKKITFIIYLRLLNYYIIISTLRLLLLLLLLVLLHYGP